MRDERLSIEQGAEALDRRIANAKPSEVTAGQPATPNATAGVSVGREWPKLDAAALYGLAGEIVGAFEPHTEADPVAILVQTLLTFGVCVGCSPFARVEGDRHTVNLYALIVGDTSKGRKGTSWGRVQQVFKVLPHPALIASGLSTGEGLKYHVRDAAAGTDDKPGDLGVTDKRLLVFESEFAQVLRVTSRTGNTLSATVREAWDTGSLRTLTKNDPIVATDAHIGIVGHITVDELRAELTQTDRANGFANRFLFVCVKRSRVLPFGGRAIDVQPFTERIEHAAVAARQCSELKMTDSARAVWSDVYPTLSEGHRGMFGAVTGRAEAQCLRLALIYGLLDEADAIDEPHLLAALALGTTARTPPGSSSDPRWATRSPTTSCERCTSRARQEGLAPRFATFSGATKPRRGSTPRLTCCGNVALQLSRMRRPVAGRRRHGRRSMLPYKRPKRPNAGRCGISPGFCRLWRFCRAV